MKKRRRKIRYDPETHYLFKMYGRRKTHKLPVTTRFLRLNNRGRWINANTFQKAGYPMAILKSGVWSEVHTWCREIFGDTYCWTGEKFWFQTEADKAKFVAMWG